MSEALHASGARLAKHALTRAVLEPTMLAVGARLLVKARGSAGPARLESMLIGYDPGRCLILRYPNDNGQQAQLVEGETLEVRLFTGREALLLETVVARIYRTPNALVLLDWPATAYATRLRTADRVPVDVEVQLVAPGVHAPIGARLLDLSVAGALVRHAPEHRLSVGDKVELVVPGPSLPGANEPIRVGAYVRNVRPASEADGTTAPHVGLWFEPLEGLARLIVEMFIYTARYGALSEPL